MGESYVFRSEDIEQYLTPWYQRMFGLMIQRIERKGGKVATDEEKVFYKCDGFACETPMTCGVLCNHTPDIAHAKNFELSRNGEYYIEK